MLDFPSLHYVYAHKPRKEWLDIKKDWMLFLILLIGRQRRHTKNR